eukprot:956023-Pyramimonas_sp.AAC.1
MTSTDVKYLHGRRLGTFYRLIDHSLGRFKEWAKQCYLHLRLSMIILRSGQPLDVDIAPIRNVVHGPTCALSWRALAQDETFRTMRPFPEDYSA